MQELSREQAHAEFVNSGPRQRAHGLRCGLCLALMAILSGSAFTAQELSAPNPYHLNQGAMPMPDGNQIARMKRIHEKWQEYDALNVERKKQMVKDTADLLLLAKDLKEEADRAITGQLPPRTVREAEVIEILAHNVNVKMKLTVPAE
jgi:hypothetical protein